MQKYKITKYTLSKAKKHNVTVRLSKVKNKKLDVFDKNGVKISTVGDVRYKDYPTYIETQGVKYANERRKLYKKRHEKDRHVKNSKGYWADVLLW